MSPLSPLSDASPLKTSPSRKTVNELLPPAENIILIASGKGGVGKTWFSISLAHLLAQKSKRILVFDGDLGLANIDIQLGLTPESDLGSVLEGTVSFDDAIFTYSPAGFDILAGRSGSGALAQLDFAQLTRIREELRLQALRYDWVFIDLGAGIGGTVRSLTPIASKCLLIINDEPTAITDGYAFLKVTRRTCPHIDFEIVINQADSEHAGQETFEGFARVCERFINYKPTLGGIIRRDPHVKDAIRNQTSIVTRFPESTAVKDLAKISSKLVNLQKQPA